jgi:hypothetical protein
MAEAVDPAPVHNGRDADDDHKAPVAFQQHHVATVVVLCCLYAALTITALLGNILVIWIVRESHMYLQLVCTVKCLIY